ncbi:hypothetical protein JCM10212_007123 [Sporobolomyces blumeae]
MSPVPSSSPDSPRTITVASSPMPTRSTAPLCSGSLPSSGSSSASTSTSTSPGTSLVGPSSCDSRASFRSFSFSRSPTASRFDLDRAPSTSPPAPAPSSLGAADRSTSSSSRRIPSSSSAPRPRPSVHHPAPACSSPPSVTASVALSTNEPDFSFKTQPSALTRQRTAQSSAPRGKLLVKLISARHLSPPSIHSRPYVVVTFDNNEFVSREPIHEEGEEVTGVAQPRGVASPMQEVEDANPRSPVPDLKGRLPLPATPGGGPNPGEKGYDDRLEAERTAPIDASTAALAVSPTGTSSMSRSPASGIGRKLEEFSSSSASRNATPEASPRPPKPQLPEVDVNVAPPPRLPDEAKTPTGAADEPQNGLMSGDANMAYNPTWKHEVHFDVMNEKSPLQVQIYDRSIEEECFLGFAEVRPRLVNQHTVDQWFPLQARPGEDHAVTGEIRVQIRYEKYDVKRGLSVNDFDFLRMIGKGTFGRVFQVRKKDTKRIYAMKVLSKREIVAKKEIAHTIGERKILQRSSDSPFLLGLKFSFQTEQDLYLIMDYKSGGELFHHLQKEGRFTEDRARFYTAEIVLAFEHLHKFDIVYRDLKPENILLDATGHIVLCDFGLSKPDLPSDALTNTFCGTTEYLAPEVLLDDNGYSKIVDFWSLGVLLFEMCCGWSPFYAEDTQQMYKLICFGKVKFPRGVIGEDGKQFVKGLLNRNPKHRLGATRDAAELKEHAFFKCIDWDLLAQRAVPPPFKPYVDSDESVANFDPEFTEANLFDEAPHDVEFDESDPSPNWLDKASELGRSHVEKASPMEIRKDASRSSRPAVQPLTNSVQENFRGFTFSGEGESMIHHAAGSFSRLSTNDDPDSAEHSRRSSASSGAAREPSMRQVEDEWEDER